MRGAKLGMAWMLGLLLGAGTAWAEPVEDEAATASSDASEAEVEAADPEAARSTPMISGAEFAYHDAFVRLASGDRAGALARLREVVTEFGDDPLAERAEALLGVLAPSTGRGSAVADTAKPSSTEASSGLARAELAIVQTFHGVALGMELCILADCDDARAVVGALLGGGGLGLGLSLGLTSDGITPGHSSSLNTGTLWGAWNALVLTSVTDVDAQQGAMIFGASQLVGLGVGELVWRELEPTGGDVSTASTVGMWTGALALMAHGLNDFQSSSEAIWWTVLAASDVGLVAGALWTEHESLSRGRNLVINAGGVVGVLVGIGVPTFIVGDDVDGRVLAAGSMVGSLAGLGASYWLTRSWDAEVSGLELTPSLLWSEEDGAQVGVYGRF